MSDAIASNPPASAPNAIGSFFGFLGQLAQGASSALARNAVSELNARSNAKVQRILNQNHQANPATGPNDPVAAQTAANRTFLERWLPSSMLYQTDADGSNKRPTVIYYAIMVGLLIALFVLIRRLFRK